jgi:hypothetical protein
MFVANPLLYVEIAKANMVYGVFEAVLVDDFSTLNKHSKHHDLGHI